MHSKVVMGGFAALMFFLQPAVAAEPIKIGFSAEETGGSAASGKQFVLTAEIWADQINAKGGLLGRPVKLIHYDDQSNPAQVPGIYTKLLDVDKIDLVVASGTNYSAADAGADGAQGHGARHAGAGGQ